MISLNTYSSKVFSEHPIGVWSLDYIEDQYSPSYSTASPAAFVANNSTYGLPMVYGSTQSIRIYKAGDGSINDNETRPWEHVKFEPNLGTQQSWQNWLDSGYDYDRLRYEDFFEQEISAPSIMYSGYGMFTEEGKYNAYTAEMWVRIDPRMEESRKIWGTPNTYDGLWLNDNYLTLVVGNQHKSYAIENWYRPMLLNVIYTPTQSRLLINGQEVVKLKHDPNSFEFRTEGDYDVNYFYSYDSFLNFNSNVSFDGFIPDENEPTIDNQLAFMSYDNIHLFEIDAVSLFSYVIPDDVLKRRFVWGQGVPENNVFSSAYETQVAYVDFPFAEYANNVIYPDLWNWDSGYLDGFVSNRSTLKTPEYSLPEISIEGRSLDALYLENLYRNSEDGGDAFFSFKPEYDWDQPSYFFFNTINKLTEPVQAVYGIFKQYDYSDGIGKKPLFKFVKKFSNDTVVISVDNETVTYEINGQAFAEKTITYNEDFVVGLDFNRILNGLNPLLKNFFANTSDIQLFVMGDGIATFEGSMSKVSICDTSNMARKGTENSFDSDGVAKISPSFFNVYGTYNLQPFQRYAEFWLDIGANAYWEDSIALTTLGKNIKLDETTWTSSLDMFQINIGYDGDYTINGDIFSFESSELKTYITFQPIDSAVSIPLKEFTNTEPLLINRCIDVRGKDLETTRFEVMNGTVVRPPVDWENWKVVIYFDVDAEGVIKAPFEIKNLSFAGQAYLNEAVVGTRYGAKMKSSAMFAIYKENTPYLYLTKDSGVECLTGEGVVIPYNTNKVSPFLVNNINFFVKPNYLLLNEVLMTIDGRDQNYYLKNVGGTEFELVDENGELLPFAKVYKNGQLVKNIGEDELNPILNDELLLEDNQWAMIGIEFGSPLTSALYEGSVVLHTGAVFQNIAVSKMTTTQVSATAIIRRWSDVDHDKPSWGGWEETDFDYKQLISSQNYLTYPVGPEDIYQVYTGTSNIVVDDNTKLNLVNTKGVMLTDVSWVTYDRQPS